MMPKPRKKQAKKNVRLSVKSDWDSDDLFEEIILKFKIKKIDVELTINDDGINAAASYRRLVEIGNIHISEMAVNWVLEKLTHNKKYKPTWRDIIKLFKK